MDNAKTRSGIAEKDHGPQSVNLTPINHFQWFETAEGLIRGLQPMTDGIDVHHIRERLDQPLEFDHLDALIDQAAIHRVCYSLEGIDLRIRANEEAVAECVGYG